MIKGLWQLEEGGRIGTSGTEEWQYKSPGSFYCLSYTPRLGARDACNKNRKKKRKEGRMEDEGGREGKKERKACSLWLKDWEIKPKREIVGSLSPGFITEPPAIAQSASNSHRRKTGTVSFHSHPGLAVISSADCRKRQASQLQLYNQGNVSRGPPWLVVQQNFQTLQAPPLNWCASSRLIYWQWQDQQLPASPCPLPRALRGLGSVTSPPLPTQITSDIRQPKELLSAHANGTSREEAPALRNEAEQNNIVRALPLYPSRVTTWNWRIK